MKRAYRLLAAGLMILHLYAAGQAEASASFTIVEDDSQMMLIEDSAPAPAVSGWDSGAEMVIRQTPQADDTIIVTPETTAGSGQQDMVMADRGEAEDVVQRAETSYYSGDFAGAVRLMRENLDMNYAPMQGLLGLCYYLGYGVGTNDNEAYRLFSLAADQGDAGALYCKARSTELGYGTAADPSAAKSMYEDAVSAMQSQAESESDPYTRGRLYYFLGCAHVYGKGVRQNVDQGLDYLSRSFALGDLNAAYSLGALYRNGGEIGYFTCQKDPAQALACYEAAAQRGIPDAMYRAGMMYLNGEGTVADSTKAGVYLQMAAASGVSEAERVINEWMAANG